MPRVTDEYREARRVEILRAASACFSERGFRATHMRDVARQAGLSTGAVYRYFPGKEELFREMLESERPVEESQQAAFLEGETPIARLEGLLERVARRAGADEDNVRRNFRDYGEAAEVPFLAKELGLHVNELLDVVAVVVRDAQADGDLAPDLDPRAVATLLVTQTVSLGFAWLFGGPYDADSVAEALRRQLDGLRAST
ncbi:MAG: TetR/AcrR family transcriptional regulator [Gemmatimonadota bacterium]|nr:TetR/AcrR family transcriptional regulator [Gemmatimonadota bacterium]